MIDSNDYDSETHQRQGQFQKSKNQKTTQGGRKRSKIIGGHKRENKRCVTNSWMLRR